MTKVNRFLIIVVGSVFAFISCIDLEVEKENLSDAFICSKIVNGDTLYMLGGYVTSNSTMKSVSLKDPAGTLLADLDKMDYYGSYFERLIKSEKFISQKPTKGYYKFEIGYDDGTQSDTIDYVSDDIIEPIEIKSVSTDSVVQSIKVEWLKNSKSDYYIVRFLKKDSIIYISNKIDPNYSSLNVFANSKGWVNNISPSPGDSINVLISGILWENGNSQYAEVQSVSFSLPVGIKWPE